MTDQDALREELERLARGKTVHPPETNRTIERATAARDDVESAAAFVSDGGRERLPDAIRAAKRAGDVDRVTEGQSALAAFRRFESACRIGGEARTVDRDAVGGDGPGPLPRRSRNP